MFNFRSSSRLGQACAILAAFGFTLNDMAVKFLSGEYAVQEITFIRAIFAILFMALGVRIWGQGFREFRTKRLANQDARGAIVVASNLAFLSSLAALPIANAMALFFAMPIFVTILAKWILREEVTSARWFAVLVGLLGVLVTIGPATRAFTWVSLLPLAAASGYAVMQIMTRILGQTEGTVSMSFYVQFIFLLVCLFIGIGFGDGSHHQDNGVGAMSFFTRAWIIPQGADVIFLAMASIGTTIGSILMTHAYRITDATQIAPFEYAAMPIAVFWGIVVFGDWPTIIDLLGISLIILSGIAILRSREKAIDIIVETPNRR